MMIVVMVLSGVIIGAAAISGILTTRQTRQTIDAGFSSKAVFAADAGLEWRLYKFIKDNYQCIECPDGNSCDQIPQFEKIGGVEVPLTTTCAKTSSGSEYDYYRISSVGKVRDVSHEFKQEIRVIK